jgi:hypothetical protein
MARKDRFPLVVLLAAAAVAGLLALGRAVDLGRPATASTASQPSIAFRLAKLDRFERSLHRQLARVQRTHTGGTRTVYQRASAPVSAGYAGGGEHEGSQDDRHEGGGRDD